MLTKEQLIAIDKLRGCIHAAQQFVNKTFNAHHLDILFLISLQKGITRKQINEALAPQALTTTKRYVGDLTKYAFDRDRDNKQRLPGFDLIYEEENEFDSKTKHLFLNERGEKLCGVLANRVLSELPTLNDRKYENSNQDS
ncbi:MAG: hypothetical protein GKR92_08890 [Gammaproteobacteria bacterium]|nr:MAG: hypothetical protein GKR92_08890 [Gammaproteobacteria bacterium]